MCRPCRGRVSGRAGPFALRLLKYAALAAGAVLFFVGTGWWGLGLLAAALVFWRLQVVAGRRQQAAVKRLLRQVPAYDQLLEKYPEARIVWANG
jgi:hypothetical protein